MNYTDEELMQKAKAGELRYISTLFDRYNVRLYNFFYQQTRDKGQSEDLTQNVFERIIKYRKNYQEKKNFTAWIYAIARNVHMDLYRKKRFDLPGNEKVLAIAEIPQEEETIESLHNDRLKLAMAALSKDEQQILWMTRFEKMKYAEVADVFDCTEGAIKAKVHRTMKNLKDVFFKIKVE